MNCHFAYSVPIKSSYSLFRRINRRLRSILNGMGIPINVVENRQPTTADLQLWPIRSPFENTKNIYSALSKIMPTFLYHITELTQCRFQPDDIFLGHPYFPHTEGKTGVTELALKAKVRPGTVALITPLHCDITIKTDHINKDFLDDVNKLLPLTDILFAIMGEYWWNEWDSSIYSHWKPKMVRLDMAVDSQRYPRIKKTFNHAGSRGYLYIGNSSDPRKGCDFLSLLMEQLGDCPKGWIGSGPDIPNVTRIASNCALTPEFMSAVASQYDFFISPSLADPNPTTILEAMAWGFPVICTPQSGYYETEYRKNIYLEDLDKSISVLRELQNAEDEMIMRMADQARLVVETEYTWDKVTNTITQHLMSKVSCADG